MAINFNEQEIKKSKFPISTILLVFFLLVICAVSWFFLFEEPKNKEKLSSTVPTTTWQKIDINLDILQNSVFNSLQNFQQVPEFSGKIGRDNPFK
jgi:hypothetical protein